LSQPPPTLSNPLIYGYNWWAWPTWGLGLVVRPL